METVVIGAVFLDIKGFPFAGYDRVGTNLGSIMLTHGGVARNVAEDMANLGQDVSFISMIDQDALGNAARDRLLAAGVSLTNTVFTKEKGMGMWLAVFDDKGDLAGSISHMPAPAPAEALFEEKGEEIIKNAKNVVLEIDLSEPLTERVLTLSEKYKKDVYVIVANMSVILKRPDFLSRTKCIILNEIEAGRLFKMPLRGLAPEALLKKVTPKAKEMKLKQLIVTMGENGAAYIDLEEGISGLCPAVECIVVDTTGAGDAFFSACVTALSKGMPLDKAVKCGAKLASLTLSTAESVCPHTENDFFRVSEE
ncbi:MAG: sugar kinase [Clostridia bacterium]|nr:sugar kinase [Clostridia bacterium]MBQ4156735.1 sugar kinase [Clostridia bacterium]